MTDGSRKQTLASERLFRSLGQVSVMAWGCYRAGPGQGWLGRREVWLALETLYGHCDVGCHARWFCLAQNKRWERAYSPPPL